MLATKKHLKDLSSDDYVFFKAGGRWNKRRVQFPKVECLTEEVREAWRNRKDKGKKHARQAFMKEHIFPVIGTAYFCNEDDSLVVLSPCGITEKVAFKLREKTSAKANKLVTRTPSSKISSSEAEDNIKDMPSNYESESYISGNQVNDDNMSELSSLGFAAGDMWEAVGTKDPEVDTGILTNDERKLALPPIVYVDPQMVEGSTNPAECSLARRVSIDSQGCGVNTVEHGTEETVKIETSSDLTERLNGITHKVTELAKRTYRDMSSEEAEVEHLSDIISMQNLVTEVQSDIKEVIGRLEMKIKLTDNQFLPSMDTSLGPKDNWASLFESSFEVIAI